MRSANDYFPVNITPLVSTQSFSCVAPAGLPIPPEPGTGLLIGYARVSTEDQRLDLQLDARARGRLGGRKPRLSAEGLDTARRLMADPMLGMDEIAARVGVGRTWVLP